MIDIATRIMLGETLQSMGYKSGLYPNAPHTAIKVPVFSFEKLAGLERELFTDNAKDDCEEVLIAKYTIS